MTSAPAADVHFGLARIGQIGITDVLVMRREVNDARLQYLDTLLSAVLARVALDGVSGVLR